MTPKTITGSADVSAPIDAVWNLLVDWERQGEWMPMTTVRTLGSGREEGARLEAFTGLSPLGLRDPMVITDWQPPTRCVVQHLGRVLRGEGIFELSPLGPARTRITWSEIIDPVGGRAGAAALTVAEPAIRAGLSLALRRLGRLAA